MTNRSEVDVLPVETKLPLRAAMEARDRAAAVEAFAEDAVVRSPFTDNLTFTGHEQLDALIAVILDVLEDLTYTDELHADNAAVLVGHASVDGLRLQFSDHLTLRDGLISEMTVFFRPLPATTAAMRRFGEGLGQQRSRFRGRMINAIATPLALMARTGDRAGVRLLRQ
jgi:ketosteroid isomerase-like protein